MFRAFAFAALIALPSLAAAQTDTQPETPRKIRNVILYGDDKCPTATADEIVVCANQPEGDRYRVPKRFRDEVIPPQNQSWVRRTEAVDAVGRKAGGLPDTCSPVGSGGQTGCMAEMQQRAAAERREKADADRDVPGGE